MLICIGGASIDLHAEVDGVLQHATSNPGRISMSPGGVARNIAENAARLGVPTTLVTWVGDDPLSAWVLERTRAAGVATAAVRHSGSATGSRYLSVLESGQPLVAVSDFGPIERVGRADVRTALDSAAASRPVGAAAPLIVAADCNLPHEALGECLEWCGERSATLVVEPVSVAKAERLRGLRGTIAYVTPNAAEARALALVDDRPRITTWVVTRGDAGAAVWRDGEDRAVLYGARARRVENANGAGDAFVAGLLAALHERLPIERAIGWALAAGAITVGSEETVCPTISRAAIRHAINEE